MRLALLIALVMTAFAANSILNRLAIDAGHADAASFAALRVASGAAMLVVLLRLRGSWPQLAGRTRLAGAAALSLYMAGFSFAYTRLDAGLGALIAFGVVQITIFAISALQGAGPTPRQLAGAAIAFAGLAVVLWPAPERGADLAGAASMTLAGVGWALYTLSGRREADALAASAGNFCLALPMTSLLLLLVPSLHLTGAGAALAMLSGAVTSGLGYALWYRVLPRIAATTAAIVQLCVPVIAIVGGILLLGERVDASFALGAALVLGGIALSLARRPARRLRGGPAA